MKILIIFLALLSLFSCGEKIHLGNSPLHKKTKTFLAEYDAYLSNNISDPSYVVKFSSDYIHHPEGSWIVIRSFHKNFDGYYAVNLASYENGNISELMNPPVYQGDYSEGVFNNYNYHNFVERDLYLGLPTFLRTSGPFGNPKRPFYESMPTYIIGGLDNGEIYTGDWHFDLATNSIKDLEKMGNQLEEIEITEMEDNLISYGLSNERAGDLGKMMVSYQKIKNKRALTNREKDLFTKELTGMSFKKTSEMLVNEGNDALVEKAGEVNGIDPEAVKEILNDLM